MSIKEQMKELAENMRADALEIQRKAPTDAVGVGEIAKSIEKKAEKLQTLLR